MATRMKVAELFYTTKTTIVSASIRIPRVFFGNNMAAGMKLATLLYSMAMSKGGVDRKGWRRRCRGARARKVTGSDGWRRWWWCNDGLAPLRQWRGSWVLCSHSEEEIDCLLCAESCWSLERRGLCRFPVFSATLKLKPIDACLWIP